MNEHELKISNIIYKLTLAWIKLIIVHSWYKKNELTLTN